MDEDPLFGSPITLAELRSLGEFVRWQDLDARVADLAAAKRLPNGYPLVPSRVPTNGMIDLFVGNRWRQVTFVRMEGTRGQGNRRIVYMDDGIEQSTRYDWYGVAPAGHFTEWTGSRPETLTGAELLDRFELAQHGHVIHSQELIEEDWPYLTFRVRSFHPKARWVELDDMWVASYIVHAADPRVKVAGIVPREPWFNTTIAVSHRWLHPQHPDPDRVQYGELIALAERLGLHESQGLLIDYCSLPQQPRSANEAAWFGEHLPGFQSQFKYVTVVLNTGAADYATRAWCMLELMLAAMSQTPPPTLLNHDQLDEPLRDARDLAQRYVRESIWNQQTLLEATGGRLTPASFANWTRDLTNVALYNAAIEGRQNIRRKFESELALTNADDRPIVMRLLEQLAFGESSE